MYSVIQVIMKFIMVSLCIFILLLLCIKTMIWCPHFGSTTFK